MDNLKKVIGWGFSFNIFLLSFILTITSSKIDYEEAFIYFSGIFFILSVISFVFLIISMYKKDIKK